MLYKKALRFAEVQFYFNLRIDDRDTPLALVSVFGRPEEHLRHLSFGALLVCSFHGIERLVVVPAKAIQSVVGMVPFLQTQQDALYFVVEKMGHIAGDESPPDAPDEEEGEDE